MSSKIGGNFFAVDILADPSLNTLEALKRKHPETHPAFSVMPDPPSLLFFQSLSQLKMSHTVLP